MTVTGSRVYAALPNTNIFHYSMSKSTLVHINNNHIEKLFKYEELSDTQ